MRGSQSGDLAILSAERYDDGLKYRSSHVATSAVVTRRSKKTAGAVVTPAPDDGPARKRHKASPPDGTGEDDEKKRSRGRPRLEPKDETAQDRRRTQIRLAQRAYRNRKENAIQTLERRVQELKDTNEEMNSAFLRLHDFAVAQGVLDRMPEIGRKLRETTQRFLALARKSAEDASLDDNGSVSHDPGSQPAERAQSEPRSSSPEDGGQRRSPSPTPQANPWGGFKVTREPNTETLLELPATVSDHQAILPSLDYEVVAFPTLENASFPFGFASDFSFSTPELPASTSAADFSDLSSSLYPSLPLPHSFAAQEVTFGRRLQRTAVQRGLALINMPNPPPKRFARIFGFCLLFEPLESIQARLRRAVDRSNVESLNNWQYPFLQLGGAGTHFDGSILPDQRFGNQGTHDVLRPKNSNGFGIGPFDEKVQAARALLNTNQYLPAATGSGGEFYDCDEVELYLHQRGIHIPPGADFVDIEIDPNDFPHSEGGVGDSAVEDIGHRSTSTTGDRLFVSAARSMAGSGSVDTLSGFQDQSGPITGSSDGRSGASSTVLSPSASSGKSTNITAPTDYSHHDLWTLSPSATYPSTFDEFGGLGRSSVGASLAPGKKRLTVDVNLLIIEMCERAICLGRSPGLRREDINTSIWVATKHTA